MEIIQRIPTGLLPPGFPVSVLQEDGTFVTMDVGALSSNNKARPSSGSPMFVPEVLYSVPGSHPDHHMTLGVVSL